MKCRTSVFGLILTGVMCSMSASMATTSRAASIFDEDWLPPPPRVAPARATTVRPTSVVSTQPAVIGPATVGDLSTRPVAVARAPDAQKRRPIPPAPEMSKSRGLMKDLFAKQLADRTLPGRKKLAGELLAEADKLKDNAVDQYVLLGGAVEAALEAEDLDLCTSAARAMADSYDVNALAVRADAALKLKYVGLPSDATEANVRAALDVIDELQQQDDLDTASRLVLSIQKASSISAELRATVQQRAKLVTVQRTARDRANTAVQRLRSAPDDPAANGIAGRYQAFVRGDWPAGLGLLAKSADPALKSLAARTEKQRSDASDAATATTAAAAGAEIADAWWAYADQQPEYEQPGIRAFAAGLYRAALPTMTVGLRRQQIESRIATAASGASHAPGARKGGIEFAFAKPGILDEFEVTGNASITANGELLLSHGTPSLVKTKQSFRYPIRLEADAYTMPDGNLDMRMSVFSGGKEGSSINLVLGNSYNKFSNVSLLKRDVKFNDLTLTAGKVYKMVITVDERRKAEVQVDGKTLVSEVLPSDAKLEGKVVLSGGRGSVVFKRCVVYAKPAEGDATGHTKKN